MKSEKIFGWILVAVGVLIIAWGIFSSFNIFLGKQEAPAIFKAEEGILSQEDKISGSEDQIEMIKEAFGEMLPSDVLPKILNLSSWSIFMGILVFAAGQISNIGIKLLKVNSKNEKREVQRIS